MKKKSFDFPIGICWKCQRCAKCCGDTTIRKRRIFLLPSEAKQIKKIFKVPMKKFCQKTKFKPFTLELKKNSNGKCFFLENNECQIYSHRPLVCRFYPFWLEYNGESKNFSFKVTSECIGIGYSQVLEEAFFIRLFQLAADRMNISYKC